MTETSPTILPLVNVIIPVYNKSSTVTGSIESVKNQTLSNFTCIIVNDGSTDDSETVIQEAIKDDPRFHYIYQENQGVAIARNKGVFSGEAPFVCCLDSDDRLAPEFLEACVVELEKDPSLGIVYTGLWAVEPDGKQGLSHWPGIFDYDRSLTGATQIPTCNVSRREVWERTGGQRQRYAPDGAGEEDAELWLRAGALGFGAKLATEAGLFIYAFRSGQVSGDRAHRMTPYRSWHPWVEDGDHPFASVATPKRFSHKVRQYDDPVVSVIIPVSNKHTDKVIDALDSLEAQSFRQWEAIVVDDALDAPNIFLTQTLEQSYPFVKIVRPDNHGAGAARNAGAKEARAPFLLFLDADDFLHPTCISDMLDDWKMNKSIVYTDYIGRVICDKKWAENTYHGNLVEYYDKQGMAAVKFKSEEYYCDHAVAQPRPFKQGLPYIWCLITALIPKAWHEEIGGFDESMISWEDWDYWIRLAKAGKCFSHLSKPLVMYHFYSGERREAGLQSASNLLQYLQNKYEGMKIMPCGCKQDGQKATQTMRTWASSLPKESGANDNLNALHDNDLVMCQYTTLNRGDHRVVGGVTGRDYGYRSQGSRFLVDKRDIAGQPDLFKPILHTQDALPAQPQAPTPPPQPVYAEVHTTPTPPELIASIEEMVSKQESYPQNGAMVIEKKAMIPEITKVIEDETATHKPIILTSQHDDLQAIPGVSAIHAQMLNAAGVHTYQDLIDFGAANLKKFKGIADTKADQIIEFAQKKVSGTL